MYRSYLDENHGGESIPLHPEPVLIRWAVGLNPQSTYTHTFFIQFTDKSSKLVKFSRE